jgi:tetratricopeptide (TPR) repeat protein
VRSALASADDAEAAGRLHDALAAASRALEIQPLGEVALRRVLTLLHAAGERARALHMYDEWRARVADEFGLDPSAETEEAVERLRAGPVDRESTTSSAARDVGPTMPAIEAAQRPADEAVARVPHRRPRRRLAAALVLIAVAAAAAAFVRHSDGGTEPAVPVADQRVLVLAFENRTGDPSLDAVGAMASDWIVQGLAHTELVDVVSASDLVAASLVAELERGAGAASLARASGAAFVVTGAYYSQAGRLHFQAHVTGPDGRVVAALEPVQAAMDDPVAAVEALREQTMTALAPHVHPRLRTWAPAMARPPRYDAYLAFVAGVSMHNQSRWNEAVEQHARAAALAPDFVQAHVWAAKSYLNLGDYRAADSIARRIAPDRHRLNFMDRLMLDWIEATVRGDNEARIASVRELNRRIPGAELVRYQLGHELVRTAQPAEAVAVFEGIDPDHGFMSGWHHYWTQYAAALHLAGKHGRELAAARQARQRFPGSIRALALEALALAALGDTSALRAVRSEIMAASPDGGVRPFGLLVQVATELRVHGHAAAAADLANAALAALTSGTLNAQSEEEGEALLLAGRPHEALEAGRRRVAAEPASVAAWGARGVAAAAAGDDAAARDADARLAALAAGALPGRARFQQARIAAALGRADAAAVALRRAGTEGMPYGLVVHEVAGRVNRAFPSAP